MHLIQHFTPGERSQLYQVRSRDLRWQNPDSATTSFCRQNRGSDGSEGASDGSGRNPALKCGRKPDPHHGSAQTNPEEDLTRSCSVKFRDAPWQSVVSH